MRGHRVHPVRDGRRSSSSAFHRDYDDDEPVDLGSALEGPSGAAPSSYIARRHSSYEPEDLGFLSDPLPVGGQDVENPKDFSNDLVLREHTKNIDKLVRVELDHEGNYVSETARRKTIAEKRGFVMCKEGESDAPVYFLSSVKQKGVPNTFIPGTIKPEAPAGGSTAHVENTNAANHPPSMIMGQPMDDPVLRERVEKMYESLKEAKTIIEETGKEKEKIERRNEKLREEVAKLEREKDEAEAKAEKEIMLFKYKNMKALGGADRLADAEAKRKRDEARRQLFSDGAIDDEDHEAGIDTDGPQANVSSAWNRIKRWWRRHLPFKEDLRRIEARFGSSVACYFYFARWVIMTYFALTLFSLIFLLKHVLYLTNYSENGVSDPTGRSAQNIWKSTDWSAFTVFLPKFLLISSYQGGDEKTLYVDPTSVASDGTCATSSSANLLQPLDGSSPQMWTYSPGDELGERLDYIFLIGLLNLVIIIVAVYKWVQEDKKARAFEVSESAGGKMKYAKLSLNAWDHSQSKQNEVDDFMYNMRQSFFLAVHEDDVISAKDSRTVDERTKLFLRRAGCSFVYLLLLFASAGGIIYLQTQSFNLRVALSQSSFLKDAGSTAEIISSSIVPLAVSAINGVLPVIIRTLSGLEKWDSEGFRLKFMLFSSICC